MNKRIEILRPVDWGSNIVAGVTLRNDILCPPYGLSLAKAEILNDDECESHRQIFADAINADRQSLRFQKQVHGAMVRQVFSANSIPEESDGMITNEHGIVLCVLLADCCGVLLYDERNGAIGAVHSGWRGTHLGISVVAVEAMQKEFGTHPEELKAYLSPCASGEKYEVRKDVAELFDTGITQLDETRFLFDNRICIKQQLIKDAGLLPSHITVSHECTITDTRFHSFRREGKLSGRITAFIGLKKG